MSRPKSEHSKMSTKCITIPLFDICEDGVRVGLNNILQFQRCKRSPNVSMTSRLQTCRKTVAINTVIEGVFA